ncbi:hypothetical protein [Falsibacillus albus]|nr:hypothetical protein [Falsibacillus albus]
MNDSMKLPRISFKGVFIFMLIVVLGNLFLVKPLLMLGLEKNWSVYWATSFSAAVGMSLVLLFIDDKAKSRQSAFKRLILSILVSCGVSYFLIFMA